MDHPMSDMGAKESQEEEAAYLKEIAPKLFAEKHKVSAEAPDGYFQGLHARIAERAKAGELSNATKHTEKAGVMRYMNVQNLAIAAGLAVILALVPVLNHLITGGNSPQTQTTGLDDYDPDEVLELLYEDWADEEWLLAELAGDEFIPELIPAEISAEDIEQYLIENDISEDFLFEIFYEQQTQTK